MIYLKQSTASQEIPLGYFLDSTDGDTEETGLTIANTDIKLWKTGATTLANKNSGGATHISSGVYYATLDATDTNTLGPMVIFVHVSGALAVRLECCVLAANVYDSLIAASDNLQVDTTQIEGADATDQINAACDTALTDYDAVVPGDLPTNFADLAITASTGKVTVGTNDDKTGYSISGTVTTLDGLNDPTAATIADAVWDEAQADHTTGGSFGEVATEVASILADTGTDGVVLAADQAVDVTKISGSATAADNLEASALGIVTGTCEGTPSTTVIQTDLAETTDDHYIGRVVVFTSGAAAGQASDVTDYTGSTGTLTVTALTTAPSATDSFVIV